MDARVALIACALLAACAAPVAQNTAPPQDPMPARDTCGAGPFAGLIGQDATALERVLIMRQVRVIRPGMAVTKDFIAERINFMVDDLGKIAQITCN